MNLMEKRRVTQSECKTWVTDSMKNSGCDDGKVI